MIIKVERYREGEHFWMVDKVSRIASSERLEVGTPEKKKDAFAGFPDAILLDLTNCGCVWDENAGCEECSNLPEDYRVCRVKCRLEGGDDYAILFDTIAYVLNDNGKTIEKIVANYRK
jgi:hypothetical protein